jgi:putative thioredoxin
VTDSPWVVNVSAENFDAVVVSGSRERAVVVDFWAEWCGPCKRLAPMLERLAGEFGGAFVLAKINTDENPELAQAFDVSGIPAVYAVRDAKVVNGFTGLVPEDQLRAFLTEVTAPQVPPEPTPLETAIELEGRDPRAASAAYRAMLVNEPTDPAARVGLARVLLAAHGNEAEARELLAGVEFGDFAPEAERLGVILVLREHPIDPLPPGTDGASCLEKGKVLAARGAYEPALEALLEAADHDRDFGRGPVRELMLKVFAVLGPQTDTSNLYRRKLQALLY